MMRQKETTVRRRSSRPGVERNIQLHIVEFENRKLDSAIAVGATPQTLGLSATVRLTQYLPTGSAALSSLRAQTANAFTLLHEPMGLCRIPRLAKHPACPDRFESRLGTETYADRLCRAEIWLQTQNEPSSEGSNQESSLNINPEIFSGTRLSILK